MDLTLSDADASLLENEFIDSVPLVLVNVPGVVHVVPLGVSGTSTVMVNEA